jgi:hypothetical protein
MDYLESRTVTSGFKNATNVALFRRNNPELCEGDRNRQRQQFGFLPAERPELCEGHEGSQYKRTPLSEHFFVFRFRLFATRRVIQRSWGFETQTVCVSPAEQSQVLRGISRLPIRHEGPLIEWAFLHSSV